MTVDFIVGHYNYWAAIALMMCGFYGIVVHGDLMRKVVGLNIFQSSAFLLYISMSKVEGATAPILPPDVAPEDLSFSNPLPHVLILTAIVVGVATTAVALALVVRIKESYGTVDENEIRAADAAPTAAKIAASAAEIDRPRHHGARR